MASSLTPDWPFSLILGSNLYFGDPLRSAFSTALWGSDLRETQHSHWPSSTLSCPGYQPGASLALVRRLKLRLLGPIGVFGLLDLIPVEPIVEK